MCKNSTILTYTYTYKYEIEHVGTVVRAPTSLLTFLTIFNVHVTAADHCGVRLSLSGVPDFFDRNKILSGGDLSHYQVPHCIRVFFYFVWFVFIHRNFQFYFELCTYCNILDIYLS